VIAADGGVLADSERDAQTMENHSTRPEIQDARERGWGRAIRHSDTLGARMLYFSQAVAAPGGRLAGYVRLALPLSAVDARLDKLRRGVALGAAGAALAALLLAAWLARRIALPLREMTGPPWRWPRAIIPAVSSPPGPTKSANWRGPSMAWPPSSASAWTA